MLFNFVLSTLLLDLRVHLSKFSRRSDSAELREELLLLLPWNHVENKKGVAVTVTPDCPSPEFIAFLQTPLGTAGASASGPLRCSPVRFSITPSARILIPSDTNLYAAAPPHQTQAVSKAGEVPSPRHESRCALRSSEAASDSHRLCTHRATVTCTRYPYRASHFWGGASESDPPLLVIVLVVLRHSQASLPGRSLSTTRSDHHDADFKLRKAIFSGSLSGSELDVLRRVRLGVQLD
eukprot:3935829-Rhodomonas_salina.1